MPAIKLKKADMIKGNINIDLSNMYPVIAGVIPEDIPHIVNIIAIVNDRTSGLKRGTVHAS